jgi:hypothetical protein
MKRKLLALGLISLCGVGLSASSADALFDCWLPRHRYVTQITCRPYNAFTPICWGNLVCDGCCPSPCGVAGGCLPVTMGMPPYCCNYCPMMGSPCMGGACGPQGCCATDMPMSMPMSPMSLPLPDIRNQPAFNPGPGPMGPNQAMAYPPTASGVTQANYYPNYLPTSYPGYYPYYPMPMPANYNVNPYYFNGPMPSYWYGYGR